MIITFMPWSNDRDPGKANNIAMSLLNSDDIGVIMDWDIMWTTPHWYTQLEQAFKNHPEAGLITVVTNRIGNFEQLPPGISPNNPLTISHDITTHRFVGERLYQEYGNCVIEPSTEQYISGLVMAIPKSVWDKIPFPSGKNYMQGMDNAFDKLIRTAGYKVYIMPGLYVYHWYRGHISPLEEAKLAFGK
jgi:GT2 family glycosyltransferase